MGLQKRKSCEADGQALVSRKRGGSDSEEIVTMFKVAASSNSRSWVRRRKCGACVKQSALVLGRERKSHRRGKSLTENVGTAETNLN